jgi:hypothetical protein
LNAEGVKLARAAARDGNVWMIVIHASLVRVSRREFSHDAERNGKHNFYDIISFRKVLHIAPGLAEGLARN